MWTLSPQQIETLLQDDAGANVFAGDEATFTQFVAGQLACLQELTLFFAPHVNSYKRFVPGSFAPTAVAWGHDNRTCSMRVVGHGSSLRVENRKRRGRDLRSDAVAGENEELHSIELDAGSLDDARVLLELRAHERGELLERRAELGGVHAPSAMLERRDRGARGAKRRSVTSR